MTTSLMDTDRLFTTLVLRTLRLPMPTATLVGRTEASEAVALQIDSALMELGFKLSEDVMVNLLGYAPEVLTAFGRNLVAAVATGVGAHRRHNVVFKRFPEGVPASFLNWFGLFHAAFLNRRYELGDEALIFRVGHQVADLKEALPRSYGRVEHSFEEMLEAQRPLAGKLKTVFKVLSLGGTLADESERFFLSLVGTSVPLSAEDMVTLKDLSGRCLTAKLPDRIPVREVKAVVNLTRLVNDGELAVDTVTDLLRVAVAHSNGDVTLEKPSKFKKFPRSVRRRLMVALDRVLENDQKLADVMRYPEMWKRLGERLHPHEFEKLARARDLFAVARGDRKPETLPGQVEQAFASKDYTQAIDLLSRAPGMLFRNLDRLLNTNVPPTQVLAAVLATREKAAGRILLSVREHLLNRVEKSPTGKRVFATQSGKAWVANEEREPLEKWVVLELVDLIDAEVYRRLPVMKNLTVDPMVAGVAVPLSEKNKANGVGVLQRGSTFEVSENLVRFFIYWREKATRTDYDLSALMLGKDFQTVGHCSFTRLYSGTTAKGSDLVHSGDVTSAPDGASEFIDFRLNRVRSDCHHLVPSVNVFSGESYTNVAEAFFGFMERDENGFGAPFEAKTVRMKSDLRGKGKVALPLLFSRLPNGRWQGKWLHLYSAGEANFNMVEKNRFSSGLLARAVHARDYLSMGYLTAMLLKKAVTDPDAGTTYIGMGAPTEGEGPAVLYTPVNFAELIPA